MELIVLDLGGVLVRIASTWREMTEAAGLVWPYKDDLPRDTLTSFMAVDAGEISEEQYAVELADFLHVKPHEALRAHAQMLLGPYPGIGPLLRGLKAKGYKLACLSNTNRLHWSELMRSDRFLDLALLDYRFASFEIMALKPDVEAFRAVESKTGFGPEQIRFFDDKAANVEGARYAGWTAEEVPSDDPVAFLSRALL